MKNGRPISPDTAYARELGVSKRVVINAGGADRLKALEPEARAILISPFKYGKSRTVADGGLKARGMKPRQRGLVTQMEKQDEERRRTDFLIPSHVDFDGPMEALLSDEDMPKVEGLGEFDEA